MKLISKTSEIVLEIVFFYKTLSFPKAYVIKFFLFLCSESSNIANNKGKFWKNRKEFVSLQKIFILKSD